jgi:hypothetical protein
VATRVDPCFLLLPLLRRQPKSSSSNSSSGAAGQQRKFCALTQLLADADADASLAGLFGGKNRVNQCVDADADASLAGLFGGEADALGKGKSRAVHCDHVDWIGRRMIFCGSW